MTLPQELPDRTVTLALYRRLLLLVQESDTESVRKLLDQVRGQGLMLSLVQKPEPPEVTDDYTSVKVATELKLGSVVVDGWISEYFGFWGGMGAGWWIDTGPSTMSEHVGALLEIAKLKEEPPHVPRPPNDKEIDE